MPQVQQETTMRKLFASLPLQDTRERSREGTFLACFSGGQFSLSSSEDLHQSPGYAEVGLPPPLPWDYSSDPLGYV